MAHIPVLIQDLALILFSAGLITILFKWLRQPVVLGYIVAGLIAGPHIFSHSLLGDIGNIRIWGEIGVIFLLFALGMEFSFRKLMNVGGTAVISALTIVIGMMTTGYFTGKMLGWSDMNALFLGGMLSMSSTTIVFKAFQDLNLRSQHFASLVIGILVVEDLFAVVLMVLLSTLAVSKQFEGVQMITSVLQLGAYLLFWFVGGIFLIPSFLKRVRKYLNDETLLVVSLGLCLGMVILAVKAGFSAALGAFVMGSVLAETVEADRIEHLTKPVKDLFGAIFFVSVGMMIDPVMLYQQWLPVLVISLVVIFGQIFFASSGVLLSGQPLSVALQSGFSLAQIGEFAFIIAALGVSLHVTDPILYPIVVAVSVITTFLTPYIMRLASPACRFIEGRMSRKMLNRLRRYSSRSETTVVQKNMWKELLRQMAQIVLIYGVISAIFIILYLRYAAPFVRDLVPGIFGGLISLLLMLIILAPLLRAIMMKKNHSVEFTTLWNDKRFNRGPLIALVSARILLCLSIVMFVIARLFTIAFGLIVAISIVIIIVFIYSRFVKMHSIKLERRFLKNLMARQTENEKNAPVSAGFKRSMLARDMHLAEFQVEMYSPGICKDLKELDFRQKMGVNIVKIIRGNQHINIPGGNERLYPYDRIIIAGTDTQVENFRIFIEERNSELKKKLDDTTYENVSIEKFMIEPHSFFVGKSIAQSGIRDEAQCLVIGIDRADGSVLNPAGDEVFLPDDLVWVAGERSRLESFLQMVTPFDLE